MQEGSPLASRLLGTVRDSVIEPWEPKTHLFCLEWRSLSGVWEVESGGWSLGDGVWGVESGGAKVVARVR